MIEALAGHPKRHGYRRDRRVQRFFKICGVLLGNFDDPAVRKRCRVAQRIEVADDRLRDQPGGGDGDGAAVCCNDGSTRGGQRLQHSGLNAAAADDHQQALKA